MLWDDNGILPLYCPRAMKGPTGLLKTISVAQIEKVLDACLNSIYQQLADNDIEVLMINDGSN